MLALLARHLLSALALLARHLLSVLAMPSALAPELELPGPSNFDWVSKFEPQVLIVYIPSMGASNVPTQIRNEAFNTTILGVAHCMSCISCLPYIWCIYEMHAQMSCGCVGVVLSNRRFNASGLVLCAPTSVAKAGTRWCLTVNE